MLMLMSAVETGQTSAAETRQMSTIATGRCPVSLLYICLVSADDICLVSTADICPVSTADISISIHHSASAFRVNNQHIMEAATAADLTQASEIPAQYITLGSAAKGYVLGPTARCFVERPRSAKIGIQVQDHWAQGPTCPTQPWHRAPPVPRLQRIMTPA